MPEQTFADLDQTPRSARLIQVYSECRSSKLFATRPTICQMQRQYSGHAQRFETSMIIGSNMAFHALTARSRGRCWKPRPKAAVFSTSKGTWRMLMHWKTMLERYYCIKTGNICYFSGYFLHYFVSPFHRCRANGICTDYASSGAGQYTSRDAVAPVRAYWKLRSRALTARELPC